MQLAVYWYRFVPELSSKQVQTTHRISVKTLMRYVYKSVNVSFDEFGLYFGPVRKQYDRLAYLTNDAVTQKQWRTKCPRRTRNAVLDALKSDPQAPKDVEVDLAPKLKGR